jgi:uncharacterized protein
VTTRGRERFSVRGDDPNSQCGETQWETRFSRDAWDVRTTTQTMLTCDAHAFYIIAELKAFENDCLVHEQTWRRSIPRRLL